MVGLVVIVLVAFFACGCEGRVPTAPSGAAVRISGRVLDFGTNLGVSGTTVRFGDTEAITDANGMYLMFVLPSVIRYRISIDGANAGLVRVTGAPYRGDLLADGGTCISWYGQLTDARTLKPVAGATVSLAGLRPTSTADGWYRIDLGCPEVKRPGNTTFITVEHPKYVARREVVGRGVFGVERLDIALERR